MYRDSIKVMSIFLRQKLLVPKYKLLNSILIQLLLEEDRVFSLRKAYSRLDQNLQVLILALSAIERKVAL